MSELGLYFDRKQPAYFVIGIALMGSMFILSLFMNVGGQPVWNSIKITFSQNSILLIVLIVLANAFWQEVIFRGYFQKRLINTYGIVTGIVISAFLFTIIHGLVQDINLIEIILGTVLFTLVGLIYYLTNSIIFATAIHATGNFLLHSLATNGLYIPEQEYRLAVYGLVLIILLITYKKILKIGSDIIEDRCYE